jgi:hypothetical protein
MTTLDSALASFVRYVIIHSIMVANSIGDLMEDISYSLPAGRPISHQHIYVLN